METVTASSSMHIPRESCNYDEGSMQQSMIFSDSLKDLKNLSKQLHSAAEYFELSYLDDNQKEIVANSLKDYAVNAIVNTVDHLGHATYKVSDLLDETVHEVSGNEFRVSCIEQRLRTCQDHIDLQGLSQQSLMINTPKYHKHYILPVGEIMDGAIGSNSKKQGCNLNVGVDWHQFRNATRATTKETPPSVISSDNRGRSPSPCPPQLSNHSRNSSFSSNMPNKSFEKRTANPHRFPLVHPMPHSSNPTSPQRSRSSTPGRSCLTVPASSVKRQMSISEPRKSASTHLRVGNESGKGSEELHIRSIRLLKAWISRRKPKKDETLYTYLDEY